MNYVMLRNKLIYKNNSNNNYLALKVKLKLII